MQPCAGPPPAVPHPSTGLPDVSVRPSVRRRAPGLEATLIRSLCLRRPAVSAFTLFLLLSIVVAPPVRAQEENEAPIFSWGGTMQVSTTMLEIPEGAVASYSLRLTKQPTSSKTCGDNQECGWWVLLRVDDTDDTDDAVSLDTLRRMGIQAAGQPGSDAVARNQHHGRRGRRHRGRGHHLPPRGPGREQRVPRLPAPGQPARRDGEDHRQRPRGETSPGLSILRTPRSWRGTRHAST